MVDLEGQGIYGATPMKVLVTGAAGFVGSNLVETLLSEGHRVTGIDNFLSGSKENLRSVLNDFEWIEGDVCDATLMDKLCKGVDCISHQAASSSHAIFSKDLRGSMANNVDGFICVLQAAVKHGVKRVVYASTSSLYGNRPIPFTEDLTPDPIYPYSISKLANEHTAKLFSTDYGLETIGLRYMSIYGPHEEVKAKAEAANLVTRFFWDIKTGKSPVVFGDGIQTRDSVYVNDAVRANILAMRSPKKLLGELVNVGTGKMMSLNEIVVFLNRFLGKDVKPHYVPMPLKNYMRFQKASLTRLKEVLDFEPQYDLEKGLNDFGRHSDI